ncbi:hypothetical protein [Methanobrevibacter smithii]|uniref:hypothetical protein n=1 Tax=Methanobrevibacter smithii TaxID=2173 RepID=UPI0037DC4362
MDSTLIEIIFTILGFIITSLIPSIFENNLWDSNVPKSFEKFKEQYEPDLDNILNDILFKSSNFLDNLINEKIDNNTNLSNNEKDSAKYTHIISQYKPFFIEIKKYIEIENKFKEVGNCYSRANDVIKTIRNNVYLIIICIVCYIFIPEQIIFHTIIICGLYVLIFYLIFKSLSLFSEFKSLMKDLIDYKNWISDTKRNIVKLSDINEN